MIEFVDQVSQPVWFHTILIMALGATIGAVLFLVREIVLGLRAKRRAAFYVAEASRREADFRELIRKAYLDVNLRDSASIDIEALRQSVEAHLEAMSEKDRRIVRQGLHQPSRAGSDRYLRQLVDTDLRSVA